MRRFVALAFASYILSVSLLAQSPASPDSADKAYSSQNWPEAERQYSSLAKQQPDNARFWYRLSVSARADKHFDAALEAMQKAKALGAGRGHAGRRAV